MKKISLIFIFLFFLTGCEMFAEDPEINSGGMIIEVFSEEPNWKKNISILDVNGEGSLTVDATGVDLNQAINHISKDDDIKYF
ncbi:MAG: hypothetical protein K9K32_07590 [Halanaerobiales bacterium]|nr:hypothetical protein [Halanaerobiales bacterium]